MATGAAEMLFRCVFEGSITMQDTLIERRSYQRDCNCALHKLKGVCSSACSCPRNISFPKETAMGCLFFVFVSFQVLFSIFSSGWILNQKPRRSQCGFVRKTHQPAKMTEHARQLNTVEV